MNRKTLIDQITDTIIQNYKHRQLIVAVDGFDASGKTYLADELVNPLNQKKFNALRASIDNFHNPAVVRYQKGKNSAEGYYQDSFNYTALISELLMPFREGNNIKTSSYNFIEDRPVESPGIKVDARMILIFDGIFLQREEICDFWDISIWLRVSFETVMDRVLERDGYLFGTEEEIKEKYLNKYIPGQKLYFADRNPEQKADIIIDNNDIDQPLLIKNNF